MYTLSADVYSLGLVLFEVFEKKLPLWDYVRLCVILPHTFQSASIVSPCINPNPHARPTADHVCKVLDKMIRNVVLSVKNSLPQVEQEKLKEGASESADGDLEQEIQGLYRHLLNRPASEVDDLIAKAFNLQKHKTPQIDPRGPSPNPRPHMPYVPQGGQVPPGVPFGVPSGVLYGVPGGNLAGMPPVGVQARGVGVPGQIPQGYPPGYQPGYPPGYPTAPSTQVPVDKRKL